MSVGEKISLRLQAKLLNISKSSYYIKPKGETEENLHLMGRIDKLFLKDPTLGIKGMQDELSDLGFICNPKRIRWLLRKMGIMAIYLKPNLSRLGKAKHIHPYLLRNM
jgi:putative transposase